VPRQRLCIGCRKRTDAAKVVRGRCPQCRRQQAAASFYQSPEWKALKAKARQLLRPLECTLCRSTWRLTLHHLKGRLDGGTDELANLCWLCGDCHSKYEGDKRAGRITDLTRAVDALAASRFFRGDASRNRA